MGQRKLTKRELQKVSRAVWYLRSLARVRGDKPYTTIVLNDLEAMASNGTTDGRPYVEPQPEVGEGYRRATEADVKRRDLEFWSDINQRWMVRAEGPVPLFSEYHYRVPIDRIPTDEDAKQRPTVMVTATITDEWLARPLLAVTATGFLVKSGDGFSNWKKCRFPYPGELD